MKNLKKTNNKKQALRNRLCKLYVTLSTIVLSVSSTVICASAANATTGGGILKSVLGYLKTGIIAAGGLIAIWGGIKLAMAIKDKQGVQMEDGILQLVAGGIVIAMAVLFSNITLDF